MDPLPHSLFDWEALDRIKTPNLVAFLRPIDGVCRSEDPRTGVAQSLCFGQISLAAAQFGGSFRHLHLKLSLAIA